MTIRPQSLRNEVEMSITQPAGARVDSDGGDWEFRGVGILKIASFHPKSSTLLSLSAQLLKGESWLHIMLLLRRTTCCIKFREAAVFFR